MHGISLGGISLVWYFESKNVLIWRHFEKSSEQLPKSSLGLG